MSFTKSKFVTAIILAAGSGSRMNSKITKQRMLLGGESVLHRTLRAFAECDVINYAVVVCRESELDSICCELSDIKIDKSFTIGGYTRAESAKNGFEAIPDNTDFVAIHDAARCLITPEMIKRVVDAAVKYGAATAIAKISDTVKVIDSRGFVAKTLSRDNTVLALTPQVFSKELYAEGLKTSEHGTDVTDDNMLIEGIGRKIYCVDVGRENLKITTNSDIDYAEYLLQRRKRNE